MDPEIIRQQHWDSVFADIASLILVCCFSEVNDSLLMWSHYTKEHRGICIAFYPGTNVNLRKVRYSTERVLASLAHEDIAPCLTTKSTEWEYEHEWRFTFHSAMKTIFQKDEMWLSPFNRENIAAIYFGLRADPLLKSMIKKLVPEGVEFYQAKKHPTRFQLDFIKEK